MRTAVVLAGCLFASSGVFAGASEDIRILGRGDANNDHAVNVSDVIYLNNYLYQGGPAPPCMNQADVNDDAVVNGSDPVYLLNWLYGDGPAPPWPGASNSTCVDERNSYISCNSNCS